MWKTNKEQFDKLALQLGSPYAAVNFVAKSARNKLLATNNQILDSEAISWVLTGIAPELRKRRKIYDYSVTIRYIDDVLACVDDEEVCECVRNSYEQSLESKHLIYSYNNELDDDRKARVRVLTRMIWFNELS